MQCQTKWAGERWADTSERRQNSDGSKSALLVVRAQDMQHELTHVREENINAIGCRGRGAATACGSWCGRELQRLNYG